MMKLVSRLCKLAAIVSLSGCTATAPTAEESFGIPDPPTPNIALDVPSLGPCSDDLKRTLHLNSHAPVMVLVHGWMGMPIDLRGLARALAYHGQQSVCFSYKDRDSLIVSATELALAIDALARQMPDKQITVIGHSQGALIARKALVTDISGPLRHADISLRLVTVAGPFAGIAAAAHCGMPAARALTLGLVIPLCALVSGGKWDEISPGSSFMRHPGALIPQVRSYLKIDTDERDACRVYLNVSDRCVKTDSVFSRKEQRNPLLERDQMTKVMEVRAGHTEIIGDADVAPSKLIGILEENGLLASSGSSSDAELPDEKELIQSSP